MTVRVGLIDSGLDPETLAGGALVIGGDRIDPHGHGSALSRLLTQSVAAAELAVVPVFDHRGVTTPAQVAAAIDTLTEQRVEMIVMALGLAHDRDILRQACQRAMEAGVLLVASAPARGGPCYPADYDGVVSVSGDIRCAPGQTSWFGPPGPLFGACVLPPPGDADSLRGASMAAGHFAAWLWRNFPKRSDRTVAALAASCAYQGRERIMATP